MLGAYFAYFAYTAMGLLGLSFWLALVWTLLAAMLTSMLLVAELRENPDLQERYLFVA